MAIEKSTMRRITAGCIALTNSSDQGALCDNGKIVRVESRAPTRSFFSEGCHFAAARSGVRSWIVRSMGTPFKVGAESAIAVYYERELIPLGDLTPERQRMADQPVCPKPS